MTQRKITGSGIANDAITADNIATGAVTVADINDGEITSAKLEVAVQTKLNNALVKDSATGAVQIPSGTTAQRPGSPASGDARFNTDSGSLEFYDGTNWISTNLIPAVDSVTGTIYAGAASTLTVAATNATDTVTVRFSENGSTIADVADVDMSSGSASVAVPAAVYGQAEGDTISISIINLDGTPSSNAISKTVVGLPTGGTITTSGSDRIHKFTSSGTLTVPTGFSASDVKLLVVAGGGGGGNDNAGGGGAGGLIYRTDKSITTGSYTITVGSGGLGGGPAGGDIGGAPPLATNGSNSSALSETAIGGGRGGSAEGGNPGANDGGSGGGGIGNNDGSERVGSGTAGQGNDGGGNTANAGGGGGGGGAGAAGQTVSGQRGGTGGVGLQYDISGTNTYYAGGGGAGNENNTSGLNSGGNGGGGQGGTTTTAGSANTGGGGGGGQYTQALGQNGGSGIVIIRYQL